MEKDPRLTLEHVIAFLLSLALWWGVLILFIAIVDLLSRPTP